MDFGLYDLFNGTTTVHTTKGFVNAVEATSVDHHVKHYAIDFQDDVWGRDDDRRTVTQLTNGPNELEFTVRGAKVTTDVTIEPTTSIPTDVTTSQFKLEHEIRHAQDNYIGAGAYWIESFFYRDDLRSGAMASVDGNGVDVHVYGPELTASILVTPTH